MTDAGTLAQSYDWSRTRLGPMARWDAGLRAAADIVFASPVPAVLIWGPERLLLYNRAYAAISREWHADVLGEPAPAFWKSHRDVFEGALRGEAGVQRERRMVIERDGRAEEAWFDVACTPVRDAREEVAGVLCTLVEATWRVRAERRNLVLFELDARLADLDSADRIAAAAAETLGRVLGVARAGFATAEAPGDHVTVERDWTDGRVPTASGRHRLADFGEPLADSLRRGEIVAVSDTARDPATAGAAAAFRRLGIRAVLAVPILRSGRLAAIFHADDVGPRAWSFDDVALLRDCAGRVLTAVDRARAAGEARIRHAQFRALAAAAPVHVSTADAAGRFDWFNARVYEFSAAAEGELDGDGWHRMVHPDDLPAVRAAWSKAVAEGAPFEAEFRLRDAGGDFRWFLGRAAPVRDSGGEVASWIATGTDIHEQRATVARLVERNATLEEQVAEQTRARERIWQVSQDLLVVTDDRAVWLAVNPAWETVLGWHERELLGRTSRWLEHPDEIAASDAIRAQLAAGRTTRSYLNRMRRRDGSYRWLSWTASPEGGRFYCVARDVTEERARQIELEHAQDALRQSQKMEAVGQLTGGLAHDFNNLLQGIIGSLDLVQKRAAQGRIADVDRYVSAAMVSANRAAALTHRLLAFSRRQPLDPKPVNANELVASMEDLLRRTMGERITIDLVLAGGLWLTLCDQNQLESALLNLAINARDAMPDGGRLTIETGNAALDSAYVALERELHPGQYVCLCVTDTGEGMPPNIVERAFDPFFTTKPIGQGTGLGLSMIYGFARQSDGHAKIYSEVGRGTTVKLYLPRYRGPADVDDEPQPSAEGLQARPGEVVLVVEDEPVVRRLIADVLRDLGYRVLEAADGPSGLRIVQSEERIDLLVTDIGLPGLSGRQVVDAGRRHRGDHLRVLFMTGYAESAAQSNGVLEPGTEMITKPFAIELLAARIRDMIGR